MAQKLPQSTQLRPIAAGKQQSSITKSSQPAKLVSELSAPAAEQAPRVPSPPTGARPSDRQIKYLGLIIEKDAEYEFDEPDYTPRQYKPIREKYILIVKHCRKLTIESHEKRGRKDFKRTTKSLTKVARFFRGQ